MRWRILSVLIFSILIGCNRNPTGSYISHRSGIPLSVDFQTSVQDLLARAKNAEQQIQKTRKDRYEINERTTIPNGKGISTSEDFHKQISNYRKVDLKVYRDRTQDPPEVVSLVEQMINLVAESVTYEQFQQNSAKALNLYSAASQLGATDPMVEVYGIIFQPTPTDADGIKSLRDRLRSVRRKVPKEDYGLYYDCLLAKRTIESDTMKADGIKAEKIDVVESDHKDLMQALIQHLSRFPKTEHWRSTYSLLNRFAALLTESQRDVLHQDIIRCPQIEDWYRCLLAADILVQEAWQARGSGFADSVSESGMATFQQKMSDAKSLLLYAWSLNPNLPEASTKMILMAKVGVETEFSAHSWFHQAIDAQVDYEDAYRRYLDAMSVYWGGSTTQNLNFAAECLHHSRIDLVIPSKGLLSLWNMWDDIGFAQNMMENPLAAQLVKEYAKRVIDTVAQKRPIHSENERYSGVIFQWLMDGEEYSLAEEWLKRSGYELSGDSRNDTLRRMSRDRNIISICQGPAKEIAKPLVKAVYGYGVPGTHDIPIYRNLWTQLKEQDTSEAAQTLCQEIDSVISTWESFESGGWTELKFSKDFVGWKCVAADEAEVVDETAIRMRSNDRAIAVHLARFRLPYEVEVEVHPYSKEPMATSSSYLMAGVASRGNVAGQNVEVYFATTPSPQKITFSVEQRQYGMGYGERPFVPFQLKLWPDEVTGSAVGFRARRLETTRPPSSVLAIGGNLEDTNPKGVEFHHLRVRKIPYVSPGQVNSSEKLDYGLKMIESHPDDQDGYLYASEGYIARNDSEAAIQVLEKGLTQVKYPHELKSVLAAEYFSFGQNRKAYNILFEIRDFQQIRLLNNCIMTEILALSDDPAIRKPTVSLECAQFLDPNRSWREAKAVAMALAANGDFERAKSVNETAISTAPDAMKPALKERAALLERRELPILKMDSNDQK